ncbi:MAG: MOSC domain-containing protein, partial [Pyrinomonadaceae bacterium]
MLTDPDGMFFTQREVPTMATLSVELNENGLNVSANGFGSLAIPFEPDRGMRRKVVVWQSEVAAEVYNGAICEWFSDVLGRKCKLVLMPETSERHVKELFDSGKDIVSFADGFPLMVIGEASLDELNRRISLNAKNEDEGSRAPLPMNRFRPNFVVSGSTAFEEDNWGRIRVGEAVFRSTKPSERCVITTVEQSSGEFDGKEPLRTLAGFRVAKSVMPERVEELGLTPNAVIFGQNLIPENPGSSIRIGDPVEAIELRDS